MKTPGNRTDALHQRPVQACKIKILNPLSAGGRISGLKNALNIFLQRHHAMGHGQGDAACLFDGLSPPHNGAVGAGLHAFITTRAAGVELRTGVRFQLRVGQDRIKIHPRAELRGHAKGRHADGSQAGFGRHMAVGKLSENAKISPVRIYHRSV